MAYVPMQKSVSPSYDTCEALSRGTLFPVHIACPARSILAVSAFSTPLLRRLGCPVVLLTLSGRTVLLPAVPAAGYRALCALSGR